MTATKSTESTPFNNKNLSGDKKAIRYEIYALYSIIFIGIAFRLFHFFYNRSLFIDELYLNINLIKMGFWELATLPFEYEQKAPIGYLWSVKLFVVLFGKGEKALRLFSLLCGIGSLLVFVPVARFYLKPWGVVLALGAMSLSWAIIYHSAEAKQYSVELFATVLALFLYIKYSHSTKTQDLVIWGVTGGLLLWFSFSLIFVLAGLAIVTSLDAMLRKQWKRFFSNLIPFILWLTSFSLLYLFFISKYHESGWLIYFFEKQYDGFMPLLPSSFSDITWFIHAPYSMLYHPLGLLLHLDTAITNSSVKFILKLGWLQSIFIIFGMIMLFKQNRFHFLLLFSPIVIVFLASGFRLYPIHHRFVLFLAPLVILFLAFGLDKVREVFFLHQKTIAFIAFFLLTPAAINSTRQVIYPSILIEIANSIEREGIFYINDNFKEGDAVYVFWNMRHAYGYYKEAYGLKYTATRGSYVKSISNSPEQYSKNISLDFKNFKGKKRLWYIYNVNNRDDIGEYIGQPAWYSKEGYVAPYSIENDLAKIGKKIKRHRIHHQYIVLYELY